MKNFLKTEESTLNAAYDAIGVRSPDLPITPEKVLKAIKEKKEGGRRDLKEPLLILSSPKEDVIGILI